MKKPEEWTEEWRRDLKLSVTEVITLAMRDAWRAAVAHERAKLEKEKADGDKDSD